MTDQETKDLHQHVRFLSEAAGHLIAGHSDVTSETISLFTVVCDRNSGEWVSVISDEATQASSVAVSEAFADWMRQSFVGEDGEGYEEEDE